VNMPCSDPLATATGGLVVAVIAAPLAGWMTSTPTGHTWAEVVDATMRDRPGVWSVLRGGLAYVLIPTLFVLLAVLLILAYRYRGKRAALVLGAVALLSNLTVQFVKLAPLGIEQGAAALDPLSGQVGVAAGVCLGWLAVAPNGGRARSAAVAAAVMMAVTLGVVLSGWHSPFQVVCPLLIATGWATAGASVMSGQVRPDGRGLYLPWATDVRLSVGALLAGLLVTVGASVALFMFREATLLSGIVPVTLAASWIAGWCAAAVGCVALASGQSSKSSVRPLRTVSRAARRPS